MEIIIEMNIPVCRIAFSFWKILIQSEEQQLMNRNWIVNRTEWILADCELIIEEHLSDLIRKA